MFFYGIYSLPPIHTHKQGLNKILPPPPLNIVEVLWLAYAKYVKRVLGPLLFLLYINDLPNCLMHSQPRMYADDTSITYASNDVEEIECCANIDNIGGGGST